MLILGPIGPGGEQVGAVLRLRPERAVAARRPRVATGRRRARPRSPPAPGSACRAYARAPSRRRRRWRAASGSRAHRHGRSPTSPGDRRPSSPRRPSAAARRLLLLPVGPPGGGVGTRLPLAPQPPLAIDRPERQLAAVEDARRHRLEGRFVHRRRRRDRRHGHLGRGGAGVGRRGGGRPSGRRIGPSGRLAAVGRRHRRERRPSGRRRGLRSGRVALKSFHVMSGPARPRSVRPGDRGRRGGSLAGGADHGQEGSPFQGFQRPDPQTVTVPYFLHRAPLSNIRVVRSLQVVSGVGRAVLNPFRENSRGAWRPLRLEHEMPGGDGKRGERAGASIRLPPNPARRAHRVLDLGQSDVQGSWVCR